MIDFPRRSCAVGPWRRVGAPWQIRHDRIGHIARGKRLPLARRDDADDEM